MVAFVLDVLIDTWWNVNSIFVDTVDWGWFGFIRYMVECELKETENDEYYRMVLIDTWWNVNFFSRKDD